MKKILLSILVIASYHCKAQSTWNILHSVIDYSSSAIHVINDSLLYTVGSQWTGSPSNLGTGYSSSDNGNNWSEFAFDVTAGWGREVYFSDPDTGYFVSQNEGVLKTVNSGSNWTNIRSGAQSAEFLNGDIFYLGKGNGDIEKTVDGGVNWVVQSTPVSSCCINSIYAVDANIVYATSENGIILKTIDGGTNWIQLSSGVTFSLSEVDFPAPDTGYVIERWVITNSVTRILKTVNGGVSWIIQTPNTSNLLDGIKMIDANTGYAVGENSTVLKTTDGGQNWNTLTTNIPPGLFFSDIFISDNSIYISGEAVYKTDLSTGVNDWELNNVDNDILISPNPAINNININTQLNINRINIMTLTGKTLKTKATNSNSINVNDLPSGIYFIEIITQEKTIIKKFIKH